MNDPRRNYHPTTTCAGNRFEQRHVHRVSRRQFSGESGRELCVAGTAINGGTTTPLRVRDNSSRKNCATIHRTPVDDALVEGDETIVISPDQQSAYNVSDPATATSRCIDNEIPSVTLAAN